MSDSHQQPQQQSQHVEQIDGAVDSLDKVPEALRRFYARDEESGNFVARINGHYVPAATVKKFRDTNIDVMKRLTAAEEANVIYKRLGEDPKALEEELSEGRKLKQKLADKELVDAKGFEPALQQRTEQMKATLEGRINALTEQVNTYKAQAEKAEAENKRIVVHGELTRAAVGAGILPEAISDILSFGDQSGWTKNDKGEVVLFDSRTNSYVYGTNGIDYITPEEWVLSVKSGPKRHYFNQPFGSGATGSDAYVPGKNPWLKESWDDMAQVAAVRADPVKAKQLAEAAGSRIGALRPA